MEFVREAYDQAVRNGVARMGWFPAWITPAKYARPESSGHHSETCGLAEMVELGVRLSDAGLGDYWDDVDAGVRNQFMEQQFWNEDMVRQMSKGAPGIEQYLGGFTRNTGRNGDQSYYVRVLLGQWGIGPLLRLGRDHSIQRRRGHRESVSEPGLQVDGY